MTDGGLKKYDWRRRLRGGGSGVYFQGGEGKGGGVKAFHSTTLSLSTLLFPSFTSPFFPYTTPLPSTFLGAHPLIQLESLYSAVETVRYGNYGGIVNQLLQAR